MKTSAQAVKTKTKNNTKTVIFMLLRLRKLNWLYIDCRIFCLFFSLLLLCCYTCCKVVNNVDTIFIK